MPLLLIILPIYYIFYFIAWPFIKLVEILEPIYIEALEIPVIGEILTTVAHFGDQISKNIPEIIDFLKALFPYFS